MLVYTVGQGVYGFTLEPDIGEYLLSHERIRIPDKGEGLRCQRRELSQVVGGNEEVSGFTQSQR